MTFFPNIPFSGETLGQSRPQVQGNFQILNNTISVDHVPMNSTGAGKHNKSTYPPQGSDPTTAAGEIALYCATGASGAELFMIRDNISGTKTNLTTSKIATPLAAVSGYSWLPGGIIMQWGRDQFAGAAVAKTVTFPTAFPTACWNVQVLGIGFNNIFHGDTNTTTSVIISKNQAVGNNQEFWWLAIGN